MKIKLDEGAVVSTYVLKGTLVIAGDQKGAHVYG
jgi:hypothetical protein